jgi:hypothetical protein
VPCPACSGSTPSGSGWTSAWRVARVGGPSAALRTCIRVSPPVTPLEVHPARVARPPWNHYDADSPEQEDERVQTRHDRNQDVDGVEFLWRSNLDREGATQLIPQGSALLLAESTAHTLHPPRPISAAPKRSPIGAAGTGPEPLVSTSRSATKNSYFNTGNVSSDHTSANPKRFAAVARVEFGASGSLTFGERCRPVACAAVLALEGGVRSFLPCPLGGGSASDLPT